MLWYLVDNLQTAIYDPSTRGLTPPEGVPLQSDPQKRPPATATIEMLRENSLATLAQRELERQIISGEIAVGTKLNEADIAGSLGVSRGPVREAFRALDQAGLVRVEKNRGVFVRQVSLAEANEIYEVRAALEGLIGRLAAQAHRRRTDRAVARRGEEDGRARPHPQGRGLFRTECRVP